MEAETEGPRRSVARPSRAAVILGNDALLAARPCTPAQLASACVLAGFDIIVPPSTGDEIVAAAYLDRLAGRGDRTLVACACPRVRSVIGSLTGALPCVAVASPPVAAARFLRAEHGDDVLITFVGDCPGAADPAIHARFTPAGFLASLHRQGIAIDEQPQADRHGITWPRHISTPGGLPARRFVARPPVDRVVREVSREAIGGDQPPERSAVVIDVVDAGCSCSARLDEAIALEPARSAVPLFAIPADLDVTADSPVPRSRVSLRARDGLTPAPAVAAPVVAAAAPVTRPTANPEPVASVRPPVARRSLPREATLAAADAVRSPLLRHAAPPERTMRRSPLLMLLPVAVLAAAAALGVAAYATGSTGPATASEADAGSAKHADSGESAVVAEPLPRTLDTTTLFPAPVPPSTLDSSARADTAQRDSRRATTDSTRRRRPLRARAPEVMPGWLPQGQPTWLPDSQPGRRPDTVPVPRPDRRPPA